MVFSPISHHINTPYIWGDEDPLIIPGPSPRRFRRFFFRPPRHKLLQVLQLSASHRVDLAPQIRDLMW